MGEIIISMKKLFWKNSVVESLNKLLDWKKFYESSREICLFDLNSLQVS